MYALDLNCALSQPTGAASTANVYLIDTDHEWAVRHTHADHLHLPGLAVRTLGPLDTMDRVQMEGQPVPVPVTKVGTGRKQGGRTGPAWRVGQALGPAPRVCHCTHPTLRAEHTGAPEPVGTGTKPRGEQQTHH